MDGECQTYCWDLADHLCEDGQYRCMDHCLCPGSWNGGVYDDEDVEEQ